MPEEDASRAILEEIAAEDAQVAAQDAGAPVFDLFPQKAAPLSPKQQRERAAKLTGRPLRAPAAPRRRTRRSADFLGAPCATGLLTNCLHRDRLQPAHTGSTILFSAALPKGFDLRRVAQSAMDLRWEPRALC